MPVEVYPEMRPDGSVYEITYDSDTGTYSEKLIQGGTGAGWDYPTAPSSSEVGSEYGWGDSMFSPGSYVEAAPSGGYNVIYGGDTRYEGVPTADAAGDLFNSILSGQPIGGPGFEGGPLASGGGLTASTGFSGPSQGDSLPFKMDDGSFVFWKNGILFGPYNDQGQAERAYNSANGIGGTTTKAGTTGSRGGSPNVSGVSVDPALEYKKWAAEHALDVAREVYTMTKGDIDRARTAATGVISFYNDYAQTFGFAPNIKMEDLYSSLYGPQVDWKQVLGDWGLNIGGEGGAATGGTDTRPRSLSEARSELKAAGASAENLANDAWVRSEYKKLSGRDVI